MLIFDASIIILSLLILGKILYIIIKGPMTNGEKIIIISFIILLFSCFFVYSIHPIFYVIPYL